MDCPDCDGSGLVNESVDAEGMMTADHCPKCWADGRRGLTDRIDTWHVISRSDLMAMLEQVQAGGEPDLVYIEHYANSAAVDGPPH